MGTSIADPADPSTTHLLRSFVHVRASSMRHHRGFDRGRGREDGGHELKRAVSQIPTWRVVRGTQALAQLPGEQRIKSNQPCRREREARPPPPLPMDWRAFGSPCPGRLKET